VAEKNRLLVDSSKMDLRARDQARSGLWIYSPLMLFTREVDDAEWEDLMRTYEGMVKKSYQDEFRSNIAAWKNGAKTTPIEEQDALFTTQEHEGDSLLGRRITVKRSKALREAPRISSGGKNLGGKTTGYEAFAGALYDTSQSVFIEQNFLVEFFHVTSLENSDFQDLIAASPPEARTGGNLTDRKLFDPDRNMAKRVQSIMDDMYSFWPGDLQNLIDWVVTQDTLWVASRGRGIVVLSC
jgi:exocyst complex component 1